MTLKSNSYLEAIFHYLAGEEIEVYMGDTRLTQILAEQEIQIKNIITGTVKEIRGDCLVLETSNGLSFINCWGIKNISRINTSIKNIYQDEHIGKAKGK